MRAVGRVCRTNLPPNTAFRGFGGPQAMVITEQWMQRVAEYLKLPPEQVMMMMCVIKNPSPFNYHLFKYTFLEYSNVHVRVH